MKMKILIFLILCYSLENCSCYSEVGELCSTDSYVGTCKALGDCKIAMKIVSEDGLYPPICFYKEGRPSHKTIIVCCGNNETSVITGPSEMRELFKHGRIKKTNDMTCWYEDREPFLCCENYNKPDNPEPTGCPPLPHPKLEAAVEHPAWTKCVEYQRYFNVCIADPHDNTKLIRQNTCVGGTRIIHGDRAESRQFPHMAVIGAPTAGRTTNDTDIEWLGGGSLISDKFILTAAHVIKQPKTLPPRYALMGSLDKTKLRDGLLYNIIRTIPHPEYAAMSNNKRHDIALVELHERVMFSEFIRPACLPVQGATLKNKYEIAGWGMTEEGSTSVILRTAQVVESPRSCNFTEFDKEYMICAVGMSHERADSCQGDSGGPLMASISELKCTYSVEGVVSYGPACKGEGVYARVNKYMDFIMKHVWKKEWDDYKKLIGKM